MMGTLIQSIRKEIQKTLPQTCQNSLTSRYSSNEVVLFVLITLNQIDKVEIQTKTNITEN